MSALLPLRRLLLLLCVVFGVSQATDPVDVSVFGSYSAVEVKSSPPIHRRYHLTLHDSPGDVGFGAPVTTAALEVTYISPEMARVRISDADQARWEVPDILNLPPLASASSSSSSSSSGANSLYFSVDADSAFTVNFPNNEVPSSSDDSSLDISVAADGSFTVFRRDDEVLFSSSGLVFQDRYIRLASSLPSSPNIYGLGEHQTSLRLPLGETWMFFPTDQPTPENLPLYGSHPFYMEIRDGGRAHGVFVLNSNAAEVDLMDETIVYRFVGGVLDMFFFAGDTPDAVLQQYHSLIGRPHMPPAWHLGFHQCRWGYKTVERLQNVVDNYNKFDIPLDTIWSDIDYMDGYRIFTTDPVNFPVDKMHSFVSDLHAKNMHYIPIVDPGVMIDPNYQTYTTGVENGVFLPSLSSDPNERFLVGKLWPGLVHFPDWTNNNTQQWWSDSIRDFHSHVPIDGLWTDMNEISNFCDGRCTPNVTDPSAECICGNEDAKGSIWDLPWPSSSRQALHKSRPCWSSLSQGDGLDCGTIEMSAVHANGVKEYDLHNLHGYMQSVATAKALQSIRQHRPVVITRSTFPGSGVYATHWLGDNHSTFESMRRSISGMLTMNFFGISMVGADICGFVGTATTELCVRWYQLGVLYPFSRSHNTLLNKGDQEAYAFPDAATRAVVRNAVRRRYRLHSYLYTALAWTHREGGAVARALLLDYADDAVTLDLDDQFMLGNSLLACPQLYEGALSVRCYIPDHVFYDYETGIRVPAQKSWTTFPTPLEASPLLIRGGSILPLNTVFNTIAESRSAPLQLTIALDAAGKASGRIFLDDGDSVDTIASGDYIDVYLNAFRSSRHDVLLDGLPVFASGSVPNEAIAAVKSVSIFPKCDDGFEQEVRHADSHEKFTSIRLNQRFRLRITCVISPKLDVAFA